MAITIWQRNTLVALGVVVVTNGCAGSEDGLTTCENGIVVYADVACEVVSFDADRLDESTQRAIDELKAEAEADPSVAVANAQTMQRLIAAQPFQVCDALQHDPDGDFVNAETIAPLAREYAATICPDPATVAELTGS